MVSRLLPPPPEPFGSYARLVVFSGWCRFQKARSYYQRLRDRRLKSYSKRGQVPPLRRCICSMEIPSSGVDRGEVMGLSDQYLAHRFDLLGSGWVRVVHGMSCRGLEGRRFDMGMSVTPDREGKWLAGRVSKSNLKTAQRLWRLVDERYEPVDWHLDFKSGYRWSETLWYRDLPVPPAGGADVKVPWELARMQHLPILALAYGYASGAREGLKDRSIYAMEFRNQVLDFIATNPPRFGVNWYYAMDVGIRAANWLVAYDLFRAYGAEFDPDFDAAFRRSIYEHGRHIVGNLEWHPELRTNHYLANVVGLLFIAAYLARTRETDAWLAFSVQELIEEVKNQFYPEGANFEASTCYHRFSAEMVTYATALVLGLPKGKREALLSFNNRMMSGYPRLNPPPLPHYPLEGTDRMIPFPRWYFERLERMAGFTSDLTKPNGRIAQIGDNDSGRFLKVGTVYDVISAGEARETYSNLEGYTGLPDDSCFLDEDHLDHRNLAQEIEALFGKDNRGCDTDSGVLAAGLVRSLARGGNLPSCSKLGEPDASRRIRIGDSGGFEWGLAEICSLPEAKIVEEEIPFPGGGLLEGLFLCAYPDFGVYVYRSKRLFLAIRCGPVGQNGFGGHAHNDQLSIELNVDGEDWIADPGTYLYTPLPRCRDAYRSVKAHFAPRLGDREPGRMDLGLFRMGNEAEGRCVYFREDGFIGGHTGFGIPAYRSVTVRDHSVSIKDAYIGVPPDADEGTGLVAFWSSAPPFSPGYGSRLRKHP